MIKQHKNLPSNKWLSAIAALVIVISICLSFYYSLNNSRKDRVTSSSTKTITSTRSTSSSQPTKTTTPTSTEPSTPGGIIDENGQAGSNLPPDSDWISSSNGDITLQLPSADSVIKNGDTLTGLASVNNVNFALSDSDVGLIDQGSLSVVNGKFTGKMEFTPHSNSGTLQVYYPSPVNGAEEDLVEINVSFN